MHCPTCDRSNPADAKFCIYCAAQLSAAAPQPTAATGPTTRLAPEPMYTIPTATPAVTAGPMPAAQQAAASVAGGLPHYKEWIGGVFLIGLGLLFLTDSFFPGILVLVGIVTYLVEAGRGQRNKAMRNLILFAGLAVLFWTDSIFPGILFLLGGIAMFSKRRGFC